jgi:hypothetical protein
MNTKFPRFEPRTFRRIIIRTPHLKMNMQSFRENRFLIQNSSQFKKVSKYGKLIQLDRLENSFNQNYSNKLL